MNFLNKIYDFFIKIPRTYYGLEEELEKLEKNKNRTKFQEYKYFIFRSKYVNTYWKNSTNIKERNCRCNWEIN